MTSTEPNRPTLHALAGIPTAAGKEHRVVRFIDEWLAERPRLTKTTDDAGNFVIAHEDVNEPPVLLTAHLDHPGFVVAEVESDRDLALDFLGGVHEHYFPGARVLIYPAGPGDDRDPIPATITTTEPPDPPDRLYRAARAQADAPPDHIKPGDLAVWDLPDPHTDPDGLFHARACDDLAALAAALDALDRVAGTSAAKRAALLCTRAEEVGFIGAIAACKLGTIPPGSRVIALENSRAFPDSPHHAGPIVRVGDRLSTFSPTLNAAVARVAQSLTGEQDPDVGRPKITSDSTFKWQRKLMPGGACEATAYHAYGHEATCVCLPLGNYHNMAELTAYEEAVKAKRKPEARIAPEYISTSDYDGLVDLLAACASDLQAAEPVIDRLEKLYTERKSILD